jgi:hypothetical protein
MSEDDAATLAAVDWTIHDAPSPTDSIKSDIELEDRPAENGSQALQKRRRVTRACDECRRKKIKCDGKHPCTHCSVYSYGTFLYVGVIGPPYGMPLWKYLPNVLVLTAHARLYLR